MSYKAMWRNRNVRSCSADGWVASYTTGHVWPSGGRIPEGMGEYGAFRYFHNNAPTRHLQPPEYGRLMAIEDIDALNRETGRTVPYGRNVCQFVMSRAARRRGYTTKQLFYNSRVQRHNRRLTNASLQPQG